MRLYCACDLSKQQGLYLYDSQLRKSHVLRNTVVDLLYMYGCEQTGGLFQHGNVDFAVKHVLYSLTAQMRLLGSTALEEEGADDRTPVPMDFLMEVMETRESLEECSSPEEVKAISAETSAAIDECLRDMNEALKAGGGKEELSDAAVRLRYLYRIQKEAQRVLHGLEDSRASPAAGSS